MSSEKDQDDVLFNKKSRKEKKNSDVNSEDERKHNNQSRRKGQESSGSEREHDRKHKKSDRRKRKSRSRCSSDEYSDSGSDSEDDESEYSGSDSKYSDSESESLGSEESESEEERRRRKRKERKRRKEREEERERKRRRKEKERMKRKKEKEDKRKKKKKEKKEKGKKGAVTNSWGKYGVIRETDMWNKRPEFTAWLAEVKQVNLESLSNWEEKQMFKEFMEDHNTATFPSKKYYNLDAYHRRQMEKEMKKGFKKVAATERTVFNDEEQRRLELQQAREKHKEEQVIALKRSMQSGMAQAMKEQAQLREEMAYQYKLGNFEAAAAIQRRLDPDAAM